MSDLRPRESEPAAAGGPILVAGSIALDSIETPFTARDDVLGGAATHFAAAASLFAPVRLLGVVGADFPMAELDFLAGRGVDLSGVSRADGPSFRWRGRYHLDMDQRDTLDLQLGVFAGFRPEVPAAFSGSPVLFLANVDPDVQLHVLGQARGARLVACDTIDHWIHEKRPRIDELFSRVDLVFLNEDEARLYADSPNLHVAAARILDRGCRAVCLKKGENGALAYLRRPDGELSLFACPAYPLEAVVDPTGAGDAFAGGVIGHLARTASFDLAGLRQAVAVGTVMASFNVEAFGPAALAGLSLADVRERAETLRRMLELELSQL